jgi:hypothetical protein
MKTIFLTISLLIAGLSAQAQVEWGNLDFPYATGYESFSDYHFMLDNQNLYAESLFSPLAQYSNYSSMLFESPFDSPFSGFSTGDNFLTNSFGASYADDTSDDWLPIDYGTVENALKIPVGNGTAFLLIIAGLYAAVVFGRKKVTSNE